MRRTKRTIDNPTDSQPADIELQDSRSGRIRGAAMRSWTGPPEVDLAALFANPCSGGSVGGSAAILTEPPAQPDGAGSPAKRGSAPTTVSLSDGTQITFTSAGSGIALDTVGKRSANPSQ
jgi:hypothetical protein